jgi:hypothetical protein
MSCDIIHVMTWIHTLEREKRKKKKIENFKNKKNDVMWCHSCHDMNKHIAMWICTLWYEQMNFEKKLKKPFWIFFSEIYYL